MTRRTVLAAALAGSASLAFPSPRRLSRAAPHPVIGEGEYRYECIHDWLTPPDNLKWGDTHGIAVDEQHRIYISHTVHPASVKADAICVFDDQGKFVTSWGSRFAGGGHGLDIRKEGSQEFLYHCDIEHRKVVKTTLPGEVLWEVGMPTESGVYATESKWCPTNVAFDPNGDVIVADGYGSSYIHRYSVDGAYKGILIRPGKDAGFVREPHGLFVDARGLMPKLVVADRGNNRLQEFTLDGKHLGFVKAGMRRPCHVHYKHGLGLVPDLNSVVTILGANNQVVASLGDGNPSELRDSPRDRFIPGKFIHPHAANWINGHDILVVEWVPIGRVTLLRHVS